MEAWGTKSTKERNSSVLVFQTEYTQESHAVFNSSQRSKAGQNMVILINYYTVQFSEISLAW